MLKEDLATMRGVNLDTYSLSLLTAKEDIANPRNSTNWALFTYDGITNNLKLADSGVGGLVELAGKFHAARPMYGLCRVGVSETGEPRVAMICWVGPNVDEIRQAECASHIPAIKSFFKEAHAFVAASSIEEISEERLAAAVGKVRPPAQPQRRSSLPADREETVGTNYRKTNAAMEMRRINRDSFWARAEREEEERKEEERRRAADERRRRERERIMQERREAEERDRKMNEKLQMIEEQRRQQALMEEEMRRQEKARWDQQKREHEEELRERFKRSESIEKAAEAAALVSQRSSNPREFFRQLSSSSKSPASPMSPNSGKPPLRRYRRSLTDTAFIFQRPDGGVVSPPSPREASPFAHSLRQTSASPPPYATGFPLRSPPASPQRSNPPAAPLPSSPPFTALPSQEPAPQSPSTPPSPASSGLQASLVQLPSPPPPDTPLDGATMEPLTESQEQIQDLAIAAATPSDLEPEAGLCVRAVLVEEEEEEEEEEEQKAEAQTEQVKAPTSGPGTVIEEDFLPVTESWEAPVEPEAEAEAASVEESQCHEPLQLGQELEDLTDGATKEEQEEEQEEEVKEEEVEQHEVYVEAGQDEQDKAWEEEPIDAGEEALEHYDDLNVKQCRTLPNGSEKEYMHLTGMDPDAGCTTMHDGIVEEQGKEISENGNHESPERQLCVRALYDYEAEDESELSFAPGDIIRDVETVDIGWWRGCSQDGRQGLFPANYVETI